MDSANRGMVVRLLDTLASSEEQKLSDAELLSRFVQTRNEAAFRELIRRLGPTVYGVCRRHLNNSADADDAFQATFFVLARKAQFVRPPERVAVWIYGVASLASRKLRQSLLRRQIRERSVRGSTDNSMREAEINSDILPVIDEELAQLPDNYRIPIVICGLRGLTITQAASELGWPVGTLATRLRRGRNELKSRLIKRGITLTVAGLASGGWSELIAGIPSSLIVQTMAAVLGEHASPLVAALTTKVIKSMTWTHIRITTVSLLIVTALSICGVAIISNGIAAPKLYAPVPAEIKTAIDRVEWNNVAGLLRQESIRKEIGLSDENHKTLAAFRKERLMALKQSVEEQLKTARLENAGGVVKKTAGQPNSGVNVPATVAATEILVQYLTSMREVETEFAKKTTQILKPAGVKRLKQAILQSAGPMGLLDRVAVRELQLTPDQEDQIALVVERAKSPFNMVLSSVVLENIAREQNAILNDALKLLSPEQMKRWDLLIGKKFSTIDLLRAGPKSEESLAATEGE